MNGNHRIKGAGASVPLNAHQNYSLFTIHYSLTAAKDNPICVPTLEHGNEKNPQSQKSTHYPLPTTHSEIPHRGLQ